jgi:hypothetical protein
MVASGSAPSPVEAVLLVIVGALVVEGLVVAASQKAKTSRAARAWAARHGWTYQHRADTLARRWRGLPFGLGYARRVLDAMTGTYRGYQCVAFGYKYNQETTSSEICYFMVCAIFLRGVWMPTVQLKPERGSGFWERVTHTEDIQFESDDFNRAWDVRSPDQRFAYGVITPQVMQMMLSPNFPRQGLRMEGRDMVTWRSGDLVPEWIFPQLDALIALTESVPRHVWDDYARR